MAQQRVRLRVRVTPTLRDQCQGHSSTFMRNILVCDWDNAVIGKLVRKEDFFVRSMWAQTKAVLYVAGERCMMVSGRE